MKNKFLAVVSAISAVALVSGILVVTANAHIGASHSPIETDAPDLVSAVEDGDGAVVCFDEEVTVVDESLIFIYDYDSAQFQEGTSGDLSNSDDNCVDIGSFDTTRDATTFTIVETEPGAVEDRQGNENVQNSVALDGGNSLGGPGATTAPDLTDWDVDENAEEITYTFDEDVDCTDADDNDEDYGAYDEDGVGDFSDGVVDCDGNEVTTDFSGFNGDITNVERVFVESPTYGGDNGNINQEDPEGNPTGVQGMGNDINDFADLTDAERTDDDEWTLSFDEDLDDSACDPSKIWLFQEDGTGVQADDCDVDNDDQIVASWDEDEIADSQDTEMPLITVDEDAVEDDNNTGPNTVGSAPVGTSQEAPGFSDAPDLEEVKVVATDLAEFWFDENVDEDGNVDANEDAFNMVDGEGHLAAGTDIDDVNENVVTIEFDEDDIADSVGGNVEAAAVDDFLGNASIEASAGIGTASSPPPPSTSTSTSTTTSTVTTGTGHTPVTRKVATNLTIRYDKNAHAFKGSVGSSKKKCQTGRLVTLKKRRAGSQGSDSSNQKGNYGIHKSHARGRYFTKVAKKVYTARNGDTIVCKTDSSPTIKV